MVRSADKLIARREQWEHLERVLNQIANRGLRKANGQALVELSDLYRSACADLAMAEQYRLSPETVTYLHGLVGRAHNAIYRTRRFQVQTWGTLLFRDAPQQIFQDRCVHICGILFLDCLHSRLISRLMRPLFQGLPRRSWVPSRSR